MEREMVEIEIESSKTQLDDNGSINHAHAIFNKAIRPVTLKFEDVEYRIKAKKEGMLKKKQEDHEEISEEKLILKGITGIVYPGEMLAMLGPSGSGKTTLLTALGGRLINGCLTGHITYNCRAFSNVIKRNTGFVTQDDILYPHLTVTETLVFTALLRLPNDLTKQEKKAHVDDVITQLGLTRCKNSIIGDNLLRGISGGERKRVSIGQEMLINPSLLLLDEPTSGLDSTTAQRILSTLKELADGGRTIVMTIHQPSSRLFYMFHKVLLLSEGNPLYFGKASDAMGYFAAVGFIPLFSMNPADFLLDLANGISPDDSQDDQSLVKQKLVAVYKSNLSKKFDEQFQNQSNYNIQEVVSTAKKSTPWTTTWWQQFSVLLQRGLKERKHESFSGLKIGQVLVVAFLTGFLWWKSNISHLQDQIGLFYFYTRFWGFYPLFEAIFTFPPERMMLEKERASGMYRLSSYFIARTTGDLPMGLILPTVFVTITYWMAGLKPTTGNFVSTIFVVLLCVLVAQGMGLAIGALIMDMKKAAVLGSVLMLSFLLAGGFYVQHIPKFVSWIKYVSISNYTYKLLLLSQYTPGETYLCDYTHKTYCLVEEFPSIKSIGLNGAGISVVAMAVMLVAYRVIAYVALMRIGVTKK